MCNFVRWTSYKIRHKEEFEITEKAHLSLQCIEGIANVELQNACLLYYSI